MVRSDFLAKSQLLAELSSEPSFLNSRARLIFVKLRQAYIKALIFYYFDSKSYIQVETDALDYAIDRVLS